MSGPRIHVVHAVHASLAPVARAFSDGWPEARVFNLVDDSLAADLEATGALDGELIDRFVSLARYCEHAGADAVLFSCSAYNAAIDACKQAASVPVLKPDEAMVDEGLDLGPRIAILATFEPSIVSLTEQATLRAAERGMGAMLNVQHVAEALDALNAGDAERHDALVAEAAAALPPVDAVLLAQFSMARAADAARASTSSPVLSSPASAVARLRSLL